MNILHVSTATSWRGGEQQIAYLLGELNKINIPQTVCCPAHSPLHQFCEAGSIDVHPYKSRGFSGIKLAKILRDLCLQKNSSILHAHDSHAHTAAVLSAAIFKNKTPVVLSRKVDFRVSRNPLSRWKYNHPSIKKILCVSEKVREITGHDIRDQNKLTVVYDGIDLDKFNPGRKGSLLRGEYGLATHTRLVGNASALADHKDYFTFLDTAEIVLKKNPDTRFIIIGSGPEKKNIENYIAGKKLGHAVFMAGFRENIHQLLPELDVFLMTSVTEGLGSIVLDAFAAGVPVVATKAGGIPEIVTHDQTGLVAPVKNAPLLALQVCALLDDEALYKRIRQDAMLFVRNFSKEKMALHTLGVYEEVLK